MKELVEHLVRSLVDEPDEVHVSEVDRGRLVIYQIEVNQDDLGKVIGRQGRIANALRTVVGAARGDDEETRYTVEILS